MVDTLPRWLGEKGKDYTSWMCQGFIFTCVRSLGLAKPFWIKPKVELGRDNFREASGIESKGWKVLL